MKVAVFPSDDGGCGWYRLRWPAQVIASQGHDVIVDPEEMAFYRHAETHEPIRVDLDADVAVVQRTVRGIAVDFVATLKASGHRVVVDVDDDLDSLHDGHPYIAALNSGDRSPGNLHAVCQMADVVTVTTPALAERYGYGKAVLLPNLVPSRYLSVKPRQRGPLRVGWTGRPISHLGDTRVMGGRVGPTVAAFGAMFAAWGESAPRTFHEVRAPEGSRVVVPHRHLRSGYPESVAELAVGLVPLSDTPFNRAKSWLKMSEYAALGVPCVASPTPANVALHGLGVGLLADSPDEWADHVARLLSDQGERWKLAADGREAMRPLTYENHAGRWWDAWTGPLPPSPDHARVGATAGGTTAPPATVDA